MDEYLYPDAKSIAACIFEQFGVQYSIAGMTNLFKRTGFTYKKNKSVPAKADEESQLAFLQEILPPLIKEVEAGDTVIYYPDGCHPTHNTYERQLIFRLKKTVVVKELLFFSCVATLRSKFLKTSYLLVELQRSRANEGSNTTGKKPQLKSEKPFWEIDNFHQLA